VFEDMKKAIANGRFGSLGDEICTDQLLPLRDPKADVAYKEIVLRRSNCLECLLSGVKRAWLVRGCQDRS
jgi:hypothetical protein